MRKPLSFMALLGSSQTGEIPAPPLLSNVVNSSVSVDGLTGERDSEFRPFFPLRSRKRRVAKNATLSTPTAEGAGQASSLSPRQIHIHQSVSIEGGPSSPGQQLREVRQRLNLGGSCNVTVEQSATCVGEPVPTPRRGQRPNNGTTGASGSRKRGSCGSQTTGDSLPSFANSLLNLDFVPHDSHVSCLQIGQEESHPQNDELDEWIGVLNNADLCELSDGENAHFERIWNSGNVNSRNVTLRSDGNKRLHVPLFDLGLRGKVCIIPRSELPSLVIDTESEAMSLDFFWGTVVAEFYDPLEAIDMVSVLLYGPWGCYDVPEAVVEFVEDGESRKVSDLQLWGQRLITPPCSDQSGMGSDSEYFPGLSSSVGHSSKADGLENLILTPNSKKWFLASDAPTRELGLDCSLTFEEFSAMPVEKRFAAEMWNSPASQLPPVEWKGDTAGLKEPLTQCDHPLDFFLLYWPQEILSRIVRMTNLYATTSVEGGGTKGGLGWYPTTTSEILRFFGVLTLMALKKIPHTRLHWSKSHDLFRTPSVVDSMSRVRFESLIRCIHLVDNRELQIEHEAGNQNKIAKTAWLVDACNDLCSQYWNPEQNLCVDEMMIKYTGKYSPIR